MDFQNRVGSKPGSGGVASHEMSNVDRRERLRKLALETIDLAKDPYFMKNHLGSYECKLCLTLHTNEGSYLAHTQGKKHQSNLGRRAAKEAREGKASFKDPAAALAVAAVKKVQPKKLSIKIGRPGYKIAKIRDPETNKLGFLFQIHYPKLENGIIPRYRFMSAFEQRVEAPQKNYQYLLFAAEPYETIAFKISSKEIDRTNKDTFFTHWNPDTHQYYFQFLFKTDVVKIAKPKMTIPKPAVPFDARQNRQPAPPRPPVATGPLSAPPPPISVLANGKPHTGPKIPGMNAPPPSAPRPLFRPPNMLPPARPGSMGAPPFPPPGMGAMPPRPMNRPSMPFRPPPPPMGMRPPPSFNKPPGL